MVVDDERLAAALAEWVGDHREGLAGRGVRVEVQGPFEPVGMDPVYRLRLHSDATEAEAILFRGGALLLATFNHEAKKLRQSHIDASLPSEITAALTSLAGGV